MRPKYVRVEANGVNLYRFFDAGMRSPSLPCSMAVLFVPGSGGDHEQVASIAQVAHLSPGGRAVHFYTLGVELTSALDGDVLLAHAAFVVRAIRLIERQYPTNPPGITLVAHSMGGIAALTALQELFHSPESASVAALIGIGVPFRRSPIAASASLEDMYRHLHGFWRNLNVTNSTPVVASIWAGSGDWQVPADSASLHGVLSPAAVGVSMAADEVAAVGTSTDHESLLWCNQLVRAVARALLALAGACSNIGEAARISCGGGGFGTLHSAEFPSQFTPRPIPPFTPLPPPRYLSPTLSTRVSALRGALLACGTQLHSPAQSSFGSVDSESQAGESKASRGITRTATENQMDSGLVAASRGSCPSCARSTSLSAEQRRGTAMCAAQHRLVGAERVQISVPSGQSLATSGKRGGGRKRRWRSEAAGTGGAEEGGNAEMGSHAGMEDEAGASLIEWLVPRGTGSCDGALCQDAGRAVELVALGRGCADLLLATCAWDGSLLATQRPIPLDAPPYTMS